MSGSATGVGDPRWLRSLDNGRESLEALAPAGQSAFDEPAGLLGLGDPGFDRPELELGDRAPEATILTHVPDRGDGDADEGVIRASGAHTAGRSGISRAATLARGPPLVLRLGHAGRDR